MTVADVEHLLYERSGLLGVSGLSSDMQDLLARSAEPSAAEAIELFCYQARLHLAALTAALGGIDRLVFTGGIGANAPLVRANICKGLEYLGIQFDAARNANNDRVISTDASRVAVETLRTDEELMIAPRASNVTAPREEQQ